MNLMRKIQLYYSINRRTKGIKCLVVMFCVVFTYIYFTYLVHYPTVGEFIDEHRKLVDTGAKCDVRNRSKEFNNYQRKYTFSIHDVKYRDLYDGTKHALGFVHIQKTGVSQFAAFIEEHYGVNIQKDGARSSSLFYKLCGIHADWLTVLRCLYHVMKGQDDSPKYINKKGEVIDKLSMSPMLLTMLRDPVDRYISEWLHLSRGLDWLPAVVSCSHKAKAAIESPPQCVTDPGKPRFQPLVNAFHRDLLIKEQENFAFDNSETSVWRSTSKLYSGLRGISLEKFMTCGHNPATNRMVNMLADHRLMGEQCEGEGMSTEQIEHRLLESAKNNLRKMAFFGLTEHQKYTEMLLKQLVGIDFKPGFYQYRSDHASCYSVTSELRQKIEELNHLDVQLYDYGRDLFYQRLKANGLL